MLSKLMLCISLIMLSIPYATAQQVTAVTLDQLEHRFSQGKDTLYVVNFWATWCVPCVEELPVLERFSYSNKDKAVKVLLVSLDARSKANSTVSPFVKAQRLKSEVLLLNEPDQQVYIDRISKEWSGTIPATLFVQTGRSLRQFREGELTTASLEEYYQTLK